MPYILPLDLNVVKKTNSVSYSLDIEISISPIVDRTVPKIPGNGQMYLQGVVQDSIYDVTAWLSWRCHRQRRHDVVLLTTKTTSKSDYLLKIKTWEKNNQSLHSGRDKGIPSSCPWFAASTTRQASSWIANHGHSDGIPLSLPECSDRFY